MANIQPLQEVSSKGEQLALELASLLADDRKAEAQTRLKDYAAANKLAYWEVAAIADIASAMLHGRRWKR